MTFDQPPRINWFIWAAALLLAWFAQFSIRAHGGDWRDNNLKALDHCFDFSQFERPKEVNPALLSTVCFFLELHNRPYFHHSDFRKSQHHFGNAIDGRFTDYSNMSRREILITFLDDIVLIQKFLSDFGLIDKVGLGIYPQSQNPFFHLDLRGTKARWGRLNGQYVGFDVAVEWLEGEASRGF